MVYKWKEGSRLSGNPQVVGEYLDTLRRQKRGVLLPDAVVHGAAPKRSPIHSYFEWDDTEAGNQYRLEQARSLIRSITVRVERGGREEPMTVRAFLSISEDEGRSTYVSVGDAMRDPALRAKILDRAKRELESWRHRYRDLEELSSVFAAIDRAVA